MFRDLKEYQEIAKIYAEKVSKPEDLEERVRGGGVPSNPVKPFKKPAPQVSGQRDNRPEVKGGITFKKPTVQGAQGRTKRPAPEVKKFPSTAEIRAKNPNAVGGGNAGASTDSGGTSQSTIKSVEQKPEIKKPEPKPQSKFIKKDKGVGFVKRGTPGAQRAENKERQRQRTKEMFKKRQEDKAAGKPQLSGKERAQQMAKDRLAKKAAMEEFTPYDIVLEYLLSTKQVATIEEANYVMTEMDAETIQGIVEMDMMKMPLVNVVGGLAAVGGAVKGAASYLGKKAGEKSIKKTEPKKPSLIQKIKNRTDATNKAIEKM